MKVRVAVIEAPGEMRCAAYARGGIAQLEVAQHSTRFPLRQVDLERRAEQQVRGPHRVARHVHAVIRLGRVAAVCRLHEALIRGRNPLRAREVDAGGVYRQHSRAHAPGMTRGYVEADEIGLRVVPSSEKAPVLGPPVGWDDQEAAEGGRHGPAHIELELEPVLAAGVVECAYCAAPSGGTPGPRIASFCEIPTKRRMK